MTLQCVTLIFRRVTVKKVVEQSMRNAGLENQMLEMKYFCS